MVVIDADDISVATGRAAIWKKSYCTKIGHVLGIGVIWHDLDLIQNLPSSREEETDAHFTGPLAIKAFDEAGGANYTGGAKVPVASFGAHWRESVLDDELMTPYLNSGVLNPLSPITAQSLADMGYTVNVGQTELYRLPGAAAAKQGASRKIPYGNDIQRGTIQVIDRNGRVVAGDRTMTSLPATAKSSIHPRRSFRIACAGRRMGHCLQRMRKPGAPSCGAHRNGGMVDSAGMSATGPPEVSLDTIRGPCDGTERHGRHRSSKAAGHSRC